MLPEKMEKLHKEGRVVFTKGGLPRRKRYLDEMPGVPLQDVWTDIFPLTLRLLNPRSTPRKNLNLCSNELSRRRQMRETSCSIVS